jgi:uncharacterized membrane protein YeaQ/YmgE (transglycosylase-associated protein family)
MTPQYFYIAAAFLLGYIIPEFIKMLAPRSYRVPILMNIAAGFVIAALAHYILTH